MDGAIKAIASQRSLVIRLCLRLCGLDPNVVLLFDVRLSASVTSDTLDASLINQDVIEKIGPLYKSCNKNQRQEKQGKGATMSPLSANRLF